MRGVCPHKHHKHLLVPADLQYAWTPSIVLGIERRKFGERRRTSDQNDAIRDRIVQIAPQPSVVCWNTRSRDNGFVLMPLSGPNGCNWRNPLITGRVAR